MRFIADNTVGKLRRWMSLLGYDVVYDPRSARRILRDPEILRRRPVVLGRCPSLAEVEPERPLGETDPPARFFNVESAVLEEQLVQVTRAFPLDFQTTLFSRCSRCNLPLEGPAGPDGLPPAARDRIPPRVLKWRAEYRHCAGCGNVYWEGTHTARVRDVLRQKAGLNV